MAVTSFMRELGTIAPPFELPEVTDGSLVSLDDVAADARAVVVMFLSRHCPYVRHVQDRLATLAAEYGERAVAFVAISSNDIDDYPDDAPDSLAEQKREAGFTFPYLFDESQDVAKEYGAACTPDFFAYDTDRRLVYRGRMDESRPGQGEPTGHDLATVLDALLADAPVPEDQWPSMGCSIKWRAGNEPPAEAR